VIPAEAVEAAAKAAYIHHSNEPGFDAEAAWNDMACTDDWEREQWESNARAALEAAAPYLMAQALRDAADAVTRETPGAGPWGVPQHEHQARWLYERAAEIRSQS
jgi:hypothetical protein